MATKKPKPRIKLTALRKRCGWNQEVFWKSLGVSQGAGSRYESGALVIPTTVAMLLLERYRYRGG